MSAPVDCEPLVALPPDQPPDAVQEDTLADDQLRVELLAEAIELGLALMLTVGTGDVTDTVVDWVALPPRPAQVNV